MPKQLFRSVILGTDTTAEMLEQLNAAFGGKAVSIEITYWNGVCDVVDTQSVSEFSVDKHQHLFINLDNHYLTFDVRYGVTVKWLASNVMKITQLEHSNKTTITTAIVSTEP